MSSTVLFLFSASIFMIQLSCSKEVNALGTGSLSQGKVLINRVGSGFYIIDKNGIKTDVNIILPNDFDIVAGFSTDGNNIWMKVRKQSGLRPPFTYSWELMICDMNGSNIKSVLKLDDMVGDDMHAF